MSVNNINRRLKDLTYIDETTPSDLGYLFDKWMEEQVQLIWSYRYIESKLPQSIINRLEALKSDYVMIPQAQVSIAGKSPKPDFLFVKKEYDSVLNIWELDKTDCIYIDTKLLWDTDFSIAQKEITNKVTSNSGAIVEVNKNYQFGSNMELFANDKLIIRKVETFSISSEIKLLNIPKKP